MKLLFLYFSGTGNTDYVAHYLARRVAERAPVQAERAPVQSSRAPVQSSRAPVQSSRAPVQSGRAPVELELRSLEWQPAGAVDGFDLLALGFPVYAGDAPQFVQDYVAGLPSGEGRGATVFCTMGAYAAGAVRLNLQRLAARGYVPLAGGGVLMPGTDGLSIVGKDSWMARKALQKDYDHLKDADRLAGEMAALLDGRPVEDARLPLPAQARPTPAERLWAYLYGATEGWVRRRLHADEACRACGLCARLCPVDNVELRDGRAHFGGGCVLCLRCLHACPQEAIQIARLTAGKLRWKGPRGDFQPLRMRPG